MYGDEPIGGGMRFPQALGAELPHARPDRPQMLQHRADLAIAGGDPDHPDAGPVLERLLQQATTAQGFIIRVRRDHEHPIVCLDCGHLRQSAGRWRRGARGRHQQCGEKRARGQPPLWHRL